MEQWGIRCLDEDLVAMKAFELLMPSAISAPFDKVLSLFSVIEFAA
jgi:hypothetical protein